MDELTDAQIYYSPEYQQYALILDEHAALHYAREEILATRERARLEAPPLPPFQELYATYLQSPEWRQRADAAKARFGNRCALCNAEGPLQAHHRTYERVGNEIPEDLIALCAGCHDGFHRWPRLSRRRAAPRDSNRIRCRHRNSHRDQSLPTLRCQRAKCSTGNSLVPPPVADPRVPRRPAARRRPNITAGREAGLRRLSVDRDDLLQLGGRIVERRREHRGGSSPFTTVSASSTPKERRHRLEPAKAASLSDERAHGRPVRHLVGVEKAPSRRTRF